MEKTGNPLIFALSVLYLCRGEVGEVSNSEKFQGQNCRLRNDATFYQKLI